MILIIIMIYMMNISSILSLITAVHITRLEEDEPRAVSRACIGYDQREYFVGDDAEAKRDVLKIIYPNENGVVNNWDDMEKIWCHIFTHELRVDPVEHNVLITDNPMNFKLCLKLLKFLDYTLLTQLSYLCMVQVNLLAFL